MNLEFFDFVLIIIIISAFVLCLVYLNKVIQEGFLRKWNLYIGIFFGLLLVAYAIYNVISHKIDSTGWAQIFLTLGLVIVTGVYALVAFRQANANARMVEEMRNSISPFITIQWMIVDPVTKEVSTLIRNAGQSPALNLKCYLTHKNYEFQKKFEGYTTFDAGQKYTLTLSFENFDFKT